MKQIHRSLSQWQEIIQECRASGKTDFAWCKEHQITASTFYKAVKRLRDAACTIPEQKIKLQEDPHEVVPIHIENLAEDLSSSLQKSDPEDRNAIDSAFHGTVRITFGGCIVDFTNQVDPATAGMVIQMLKHSC
jgi:hypothetical protein